MKRALITGGAGFIGVHLARRLLADGWSVDIVDDFSRGVLDAELEALRTSPAVHFAQINVLDVDALRALSPNGERGYSVIFHLAAIIGVRNVLERPYAVLKDNVAMHANVIELARAHQTLERLVFASTSEVYAGTLQHFSLPVPTPESTPLAVTDVAHPRATYMLSKIYGESMCHHSGLPFTIIRPHNFYGPRMGLSHVVPELLHRAYVAADGDDLQFASTSHRRAFCFIDDAIEIMVRAATAKECARETLNVGNESAEVTIGSVAEVVLEVTGRRLKIAAGPETPGSPTRRCPDMRHAAKLTGYTATVDLREGIRRTFDWYRENVFTTGGLSAK
ncbi:NAD-dependent epimerase/dehydratase family protein [soil metagenome]